MLQHEVILLDGELHIVPGILQCLLARRHRGTKTGLKARIVLPQLEHELTGVPLLQNPLAHGGRKRADARAWVEDAHRPLRELVEQPGHEIGDGWSGAEVSPLPPHARRGGCFKAPLLFRCNAG